MEVFSFMFPVIALFVFLFIVIVIFSSKGKKVKINDNVSEKYKDVALKLINQNDKIEEERKKYRKKHIFIGCIIIAIAAGAFLTPILGFFTFIISFLLVIVLMIILITNKDNNSVYNEVIPSIINNYLKGLNYNHYEGISSNIYREARFESWDRYHSDDLISGVINNQEFIMSEVHTENRHTDKDGHTYYTTIFHGAFAKVTLKKDFKCFLNIVNNRIKLFSRDSYITIDNEAFEKIYDVFTDDKIKAMRLLTPDVTTKMIDLYNDTGIYCEIKIINNILYIRLYTGALFDFSFSNPEKEAKLIGKSVAVIDSVFKVMENFIGEIERFDV